MNGLEGRRAVVTGGARGIGLAIARRLLSEGARVAVADSNPQTLDQAQGSLPHDPARVLRVQCDVSDPRGVQSLKADVKEAFGGLDILVNNAAIPDWTVLEDLTLVRLEKVFQVNFFSAVGCVRAFLPELEQSTQARIVNITSIMGLRGAANTIAYNSAKAALVNLTRCLAV